MLNPLFRAGLRKVASGSIAAGEMLADTTATNAFVAPVGVDLSAYQTGKYIFAAYNTVGGYAAFGYISGTAPGGETLGGGELVTNPDMELDASWASLGGAPPTNVRSNEQAHGGSYSRKIITDANNQGIGSVGFTTATGRLYKYSSWVYTAQNLVRLAILKGDALGYVLAENVVPTASTWTQLNKYYTEIAGGNGARVGWQNYGNTVGTWYFDDVSSQQVTDCAATGALIVSAKDGATRAWSYVHPNFSANIASTFKIFYVGD